MISFQTRSVSTKTHILKIGFSAKLSLSRISKKKKHAPISDWHTTITSCLLISLLSRSIFNSLIWLDSLSNWSCCSHYLIPSKTDLNRFQPRKLTPYFAIPLTSFSSLPTAVAVILVVHRSCSAHVFPAEGGHLNHRPTTRI